MAQTQTTCPKCRQPVLVEVQQSFDMTQDPLAKQKLLSNAANVMHCPSSGYHACSRYRSYITILTRNYC